MGINIGICYMEAGSALCRDLRNDIVKVHSDDPALEDIMEHDALVDLDTAKGLFDDWEAFMKRNRINPDSDAIYLCKVKKDGDLEILRPCSKNVCTGWIPMAGLSETDRKRALDSAGDDDIVTGWTLLDFDEMNDMCARCTLSWDKGRGCIGTFGPDNTPLPDIAAKYGCPIIASAKDASMDKRRFTPEDAKNMLEEVHKLQKVMPDEGKMAVRRFTGPLERLEAVANISMAENCGFFFF